MNAFMIVWDEELENVEGKSRYSSFSDSRFFYTLANVKLSAGRFTFMFLELFKRAELFKTNSSHFSRKKFSSRWCSEKYYPLLQ